jgi:glutathione peroxidase
VLAVPSNDFRQELDSNEEVKAFCELTYGIDLPMTEITRVRGKAAHPFFASLRTEEGFVPRWNFNKVLLDGEGTLVAAFRSRHRPLSTAITSRIEELLQ